MSKFVGQGPLGYVARSWAALIYTSIATIMRRALRGPLAPGWSLNFEIGNLFWRGQFNRAFAMSDIREARLHFDSLMTLTDEVFDVVRRPSAPGSPIGEWVSPPTLNSGATLLYLHGGGYAFYSDVSRRFADTLASLLGFRIFVPDYRLTPEHTHPAQQADALAAYRLMLAEGVNPEELVIVGDSAGGHLTLMTLVSIRDAGLPQPALAVGLCPWTDIGERGGEVLIDMIRDFARVVADQGCDVTLDVWPEMTHNFHAHGLTHAESAEAIARIGSAIAHFVGAKRSTPNFPPCETTEIQNFYAAALEDEY